MKAKREDVVGDKKNIWGSLAGFLLVALVVLAIWASTFWLAPRFFGQPTDVGVAGDMFGGVTALFSGLAFAGLIATLLMQRQELEFQRQELAQTREEFKLQRFENTFFGLLRIFNDHIDSLKRDSSPILAPGSPISQTGREVLRYYAERLPSAWDIHQPRKPSRLAELPPSERTLKSLIQLNQEYRDRYEEEFELDLGPYFRILYNIIRHIETSGLPEPEKLRYSKVARAYLSSAEINILMFNGATDLGASFKPWIVKHRLLKHLSRRDALRHPVIFGSYEPLAFDNKVFPTATAMPGDF